ncbi:MAG TPA: thioredoxin family protein [Nitrososphaerales archaeon]|nr:thioredoxin family protein [Nitrososphaerales archaeon]
MTKMLDLGEKAPSFKNLLGADGERYSISSFNDKPVLTVVFSCNHCPYAKAYEERMVSIQRDYASRGVQLIAINSNDDKSYPEDSYTEMVKRAKEKGFNFPYLRDGEQVVVVEYGAVCTPHVFAFDKARLLRYRGRIDDSRDPSSVRSHDLRNALDDLLAGKEVRVPDTRPFGCSIKWAAD